jgi:hypothetical protein
LNAWTNLYNNCYLYHSTWVHLNGLLHKSLPSVCASVCVPLLYLKAKVLYTCYRGEKCTSDNRKIVGYIAFYAVHIVSNECRLIFVPRNVGFVLFNMFLHDLMRCTVNISLRLFNIKDDFTKYFVLFQNNIIVTSRTTVIILTCASSYPFFVLLSIIYSLPKSLHSHRAASSVLSYPTTISNASFFCKLFQII